CGASNFAVGDKVVVTLPGAVLPGGFEIAARKTYGHVSDGMIASARELGLGDDHDGILVLSTIGLDPAIGTDAIGLLGLDESAAEVNVTPDRGYCLSIRGVAREYSHAAGVEFSDPAASVEVASGSGFQLSVTDGAPIHGVPGCSKFALVGVKDIDPTATVPDWMAARLKLAGMRSISIAVDITNYVMLELGQPLHAYDAAKLDGGISVRRAKSGEEIVTLDDKSRTLSPEDLLICDDQGPIGIAGVMGGARTEVSDSTREVLIEAAIFDPISIARSARRHKLPSEASKRFERGVDSAIPNIAASRAAALLVELAGGKLSGVGADFSEQSQRPELSMDASYPSQLVGVDYSLDQVVSSLEQIGCTVSVSGSTLSVTAPSWRPDITHKTDLVEEVARLVGYDKIPTRLPVAPPGRGLTRRQQLRRRSLSALTGAGLIEVLNYPFVSKEQNAWMGEVEAVELENPIQSEFGQLRTSLVPGLVLAAARNISRGMVDLALVEEGSVFLAAAGSPVLQLPVGNQRPSDQELAALKSSIPNQPRFISGLFTGNWVKQGPGQSAITAGYPQALGAVEILLQQAALGFELEQAKLPGLHPGRAARVLVQGQAVGLVGELHPDLASENHLPRQVGIFELNLDALYALSPEIVTAKSVDVMPAATQDLSMVVATSVAASELMTTIIAGAGELLEEIRLVDDYRGAGLAEGTKSLTFALLFRADDRTLTQQEASAARDKAVALAAEKHGAVLRG
ncbi:MAG: phenylalanine--tRNA ligase subunit beta, partial [Micrococcales bacterium]|nr:phenylalanine--tRNA ligase subunit beta [Micrococcales bacterium]